MAKMTKGKGSDEGVTPTVASVGINESSTDHGGDNAGSKAKTNKTYKAWQVDRNVDPSNAGFGG